MISAYFKLGAAALALLGAYLFGHSVASTKAELEFTKFKLESEQAYSTLLAEKQKQANEYAASVHKLQSEHLSAVDKIKSDYDATIANLRKSFKPSGVRECPASGAGGAPAPDGASGLVCYTKADLHERVAKSVDIGARCDKLATDYNTLLRLIEAYNAKK